MTRDEEIRALAIEVRASAEMLRTTTVTAQHLRAHIFVNAERIIALTKEPS